MAGQDLLDVPALADLAEARWRSGDLVGAGEAAEAHLRSGGRELHAMIVAAEALAARGRLTDARHLAARVVELTDGRLDRLFAGQPRSSVWPRPVGAPVAPEAGDLIDEEVPADEEARRAAEAPEDGAAAREAEAATRQPDAPRRRPTPPRPDAPVDDRRGPSPAAPGAGSTPTKPLAGPRPAPTPVGVDHATGDRGDAATALAAVERALQRRQLAAAAGRLGLLLRTQQSAAPAILSLADRAVAVSGGEGDEAAILHLVRGDAYRVLGREREAAVAYEQSRRALEWTSSQESL